MVSVLFHELVEAHSDPELNAWYDKNGEENADKCAWNFLTEDNWNVKLGPYNWLLQSNFVNDGNDSGCSLCYANCSP
jgi:hypothetical protein